MDLMDSITLPGQIHAHARYPGACREWVTTTSAPRQIPSTARRTVLYSHGRPPRWTGEAPRRAWLSCKRQRPLIHAVLKKSRTRSSHLITALHHHWHSFQSGSRGKSSSLQLGRSEVDVRVLRIGQGLLAVHLYPRNHFDELSPRELLPVSTAALVIAGRVIHRAAIPA